MDKTASLDEMFAQIATLPPLQKVQLVERIMATLETDLQPAAKQPKRSLYGMWAGTAISEEDISAVRREMWSGFPREDI